MRLHRVRAATRLHEKILCCFIKIKYILIKEQFSNKNEKVLEIFFIIEIIILFNLI